jgi:hypothetical protein
MMDLAEIRECAEFVRRFIDRDPSQGGGLLDELSADVLALLDALAGDAPTDPSRILIREATTTEEER